MLYEVELVLMMLGIHATEKTGCREQPPMTRTIKQRKEWGTQVLTRFGNLPTSSGQGERVLIESINYRLKVCIWFGTQSQIGM